jgi:hypothetical protein
MQDVLDNTNTAHTIYLATIPRFNESEGHGPKRAHPVADYFDYLSMHLVYEIHKKTSLFLDIILKTLQTKCLLAKLILRRFTQSLVRNFHHQSLIFTV